MSWTTVVAIWLACIVTSPSTVTSNSLDVDGLPPSKSTRTEPLHYLAKHNADIQETTTGYETTTEMTTMETTTEANFTTEVPENSTLDPNQTDNPTDYEQDPLDSGGTVEPEWTAEPEAEAADLLNSTLLRSMEGSSRESRNIPGMQLRKSHGSAPLSSLLLVTLLSVLCI